MYGELTMAAARQIRPVIGLLMTVTWPGEEVAFVEISGDRRGLDSVCDQSNVDLSISSLRRLHVRH